MCCISTLVGKKVYSKVVVFDRYVDGEWGSENFFEVLPSRISGDTLLQNRM